MPLHSTTRFPLLALRRIVLCAAVTVCGGAHAQNVGSDDPQIVFDDDALNIPDADVVTSRPRVTNRSVTPGQQRNLRVTPVGPHRLTDANGELRPLIALPVGPVQGSRLAVENDPYAALGIAAGRFRLFPVLEQTFGATDNADAVAGGKASGFSQTNARIRLQSDWSLHELRGEVGANAVKYFNGSTDGIFGADANLELRLDLETGWAARFGGQYELTTESIGSDNVVVGVGQTVDGRPFVHGLSGFAAIEKTGGRLTASLRGTVVRNAFGGVDFTDGTSGNQDDRDNVELATIVRVGYEISPAISPFVEASLGTRIHDLTVDRNGIERDALLISLRGGVAMDFGEKLHGELAVGYGAEHYEDNSLENLTGVILDGQFVWSPVRLTSITSTVSTEFSGSTNPGESGSITYAGSLGIVREVRPSLSLSAKVSAAWRAYDGGQSETTLQGELGAEWRLNRNLALVGGLGYETVDSSDPFSSYDALTARIGLRLQR